MKKFISLCLSGLLVVACLTACGVDKEALSDVTTRLTNLDTKVSSMYGKIEDMHSTGKMSEDLYMQFMEFDQEIDDTLSQAEGLSPDLDKLSLTTTDLENRMESFEYALEMLGSVNSETLDRELLELKQACTELGEIMEIALSEGKIAQDRMDEFYSTQKRVEKYLTMADLEYSTEVGDDIEEIRSILSVMASEVNADNSLIDRLVDSSDFNYNGEEAEQTEAKESGEKQPLSEEVQGLITNYLGFQEFIVAGSSDGAVDEETVSAVLNCGVQLTYLKEAVEKDGVTENNTVRADNIKSELYDLAVKVNYQQADLFK